MKFDLVSQITGSGLVKQFVYVPMLTPDEDGVGSENICRHESTGGLDNQGLLDFLDGCIINEKRRVGELESYFTTDSVRAIVYNKDRIFTHADRKAYFAGIDTGLLEDSLILLDPDKGLEEDRNDDGNLLLSEVRDIYNKMSDSSILMFTQKFPYDLYKEYLAMRIAEIKDQIPFSQPVSLDDLDTILFFLTRDDLTLSRLIQILKDYTQKYARKVEAK